MLRLKKYYRPYYKVNPASNIIVLVVRVERSAIAQSYLSDIVNVGIQQKWRLNPAPQWCLM
jgi:hypothetical protein